MGYYLTSINFFLVVLCMSILVMLFWVWMLVDATTRPNLSDRIVWVLLIICTPLIGASIYYFFVRRPNELRRASAQATENTTAQTPNVS